MNMHSRRNFFLSFLAAVAVAPAADTPREIKVGDIVFDTWTKRRDEPLRVVKIWTRMEVHKGRVEARQRATVCRGTKQFSLPVKSLAHI